MRIVHFYDEIKSRKKYNLSIREAEKTFIDRARSFSHPPSPPPKKATSGGIDKNMQNEVKKKLILLHSPPSPQKEHKT